MAEVVQDHRLVGGTGYLLRNFLTSFFLTSRPGCIRNKGCSRGNEGVRGPQVTKTLFTLSFSGIACFQSCGSILLIESGSSFS